MLIFDIFTLQCTYLNGNWHFLLDIVLHTLISHIPPYLISGSLVVPIEPHGVVFNSGGFFCKATHSFCRSFISYTEFTDVARLFKLPLYLNCSFRL